MISFFYYLGMISFFSSLAFIILAILVFWNRTRKEDRDDTRNT